MPRPNRKPLLVLVVLMTVFLASGCVRAASPRGWAQPVLFDNLLLLTTHTGKLDAIDPVTGERKWRFPDDWEITAKNKSAQKLAGIYAKPLVSGDTVYVGDYNGFVYAFKPAEASTDKANRKPVGVANVQGPVIGGMAIDVAAGNLLVTTGEGKLVALKADGFAPVYTFDAGDRIWTAPVLGNGHVYFGTTDGRLFAVQAATGQQDWVFRAGSALVSTPVVAGDLVLVGGFGRRLYAVDSASGQQKWAFEATDWIWSKPLVDGGRVYVADFKGKVFALNLNDGSTLWEKPFDAGESVRSSPVLSGGVLVVAADNGDVFGVDTATGAPAWGPVKMGTTLQADLLASGSTVYAAPSRCTSVETTGEVYYYKLDATTHEAKSTGSVC